MNDQKFGEELERIRGAAMRIATRELGNRQDAEDAVQEAMLQAWKGRANYDPAKGSLKGWVLGIVNNICKDAQAGRYRRAASEFPDPYPDRLAEPEDLTPAVDLLLDTRSAFGGLSPMQRQVMELVEQGLTYREIAEELGSTPGSVKVLAHQARRALRRALKETYQDEGGAE